MISADSVTDSERSAKPNAPAQSGMGSLLLNLAERFRCEVKVSLNWKTERTPRAFKFGQGEIAPLFLKADDITEENEVTLLLRALGHVPGPIRVRCKELDVGEGVWIVFLAVERRQRFPCFCTQQFHRNLLGDGLTGNSSH